MGPSTGSAYPRARMISLDIATFLLQWAIGGLAYLWVTTRRREVSIGYGWLMRAIFGLLALLSAVVGFRYGAMPVRDVSVARGGARRGGGAVEFVGAPGRGGRAAARTGAGALGAGRRR